MTALRAAIIIFGVLYSIPGWAQTTPPTAEVFIGQFGGACLGGSNNEALCTTSSQCPGGTCLANSTPSDDPSCGTGMGTAPAPHPCAHISYFFASEPLKRADALLAPGVVVNIAPGTYRTDGPSGLTDSCIKVSLKGKGVTYRGRSRTNQALSIGDTTSVKLDMTGASIHGYCSGSCFASNAVRHGSSWQAADDYSGLRIRNIGCFNSPAVGNNGGIAGNFGGPFPASVGNVPTDIILEDVEFNGGTASGGFRFGVSVAGYNQGVGQCEQFGPSVRNIQIIRPKVRRNKGGAGNGGIFLGCVQGVKLEDPDVSDNCGLADCSLCSDCYKDPLGPSCPSRSLCDDVDGIVGVGAIDVHMYGTTNTSCIVARNGEEGVDIGGHQWGSSRYWTVERCRVHDSGGDNTKVSGGAYVTLANNIVYGTGGAYKTYGGAHDVNIINNTFRVLGSPGHSFYYLWDSLYLNNIWSSSGTLQWDLASTNASGITKNRWMYNHVTNRGAGAAMYEIDGGLLQTPACDGCKAAYPGCTRSACTSNAQCPAYGCTIPSGQTSGYCTGYEISNDRGNNFEPPPIPCVKGPVATPNQYADTPAGLSTWQARGDAGEWFGADTGEGDRWPGIEPKFKNVGANDFHRADDDTEAKDRGVDPLPYIGAQCNTTIGRCRLGRYGVPCTQNNDCRLLKDFDDELRGTSWSMGADEPNAVSSPPATPTNLRVTQ